MNFHLMTRLMRPSNRRLFLLGAIAGAGVLAILRRHTDADEIAQATPQDVTIVEFTDAGERKESVTKPKVVKSEEEWQKQLPEDSFAVTRKEGTEAPFSGDLLNVHDAGVFRCICCDNALFNASTKFDSGTGWPSFWAPIAEENVTKIKDTSFLMVRVAVACTLCDAHLGHVFDDGPAPTGLRYCMNSVSLRFTKATA